MIKQAGYKGMDWVEALKARPKDQPTDLGMQKEADIEDALGSTANVAFGTPVRTEDKGQALIRASREIAENKAKQMDASEANSIREKLASASVDPVVLGVATKEEWASSNDPSWVKEVATKAALAQEKNLKHAWEKDVVQPSQHLSSTFDPMTMRDGRIMSSTAGANDETCSKPSRVPANAASILDPYRIDKLAAAKNEHDESVKTIRAAEKARIEGKKAELKPKEEGPEPMHGGKVVASGGLDSDVFVQRVPSNQVSMLDNLGDKKASPEEIKERLSAIFAARIVDHGQEIKEANAKRKEDIKGKAEKDRSWEKVSAPLKTSDLTKRISDLWMPQAPVK